MKLSDLADFNPRTPLIRESELPFIDMATLPTNARDIPNFKLRVVNASGSKFQNGDTLLARITPCLENGKGGRVANLPGDGLGHGSTEFIVLRPKLVSDVEFVYYLSRHPNFRNFAIKQMTGTSGRQRVAWQSLTDYQLPDLDKFSRPAIGEVLSSLDDKIELNRRMNATLEEMARALFKDWFVDFGPTRAKMEGRAPYLASDIWSLFPDAFDEDGKPEGWKLGILADVADSPRRGVSPADVAEDTPYIGLEHMPRRSIALSEWEGAGKVSSNKSVFKKGEFLFGKLRPYFHKVGFAPLDGICSTDIVVVVPRSPKWGAFTLACLSSNEFVNYTDQTSTGTKMPRTSWKTMGRYKVCLPSEQIACAFQSIAQPLLDRISTNIHESRTLAALRDTLLPKLISGEIHVTEAEKPMEAVT